MSQAGVTESRIEHARATSTERARKRWNRLRSAGLCTDCGEAPAPTGYCEACRELRRLKYRVRREREPLVRRFEVALQLVRQGQSARDALDNAGILAPLLRGEL